MDPLLRAAVIRRDREQAICAEFDLQAADETRMRILETLTQPKCRT